jgi:acetyl-CoA carboxylase biotin carboxyl carrier protein
MPRRRAPGKSSGKSVKPPSRIADTPRGALLSAAELTELRQLIRLVRRTGIGEIELSAGGRSVRVSANAGAPVAMSVPAMAPGTRSEGAGRQGSGATGGATSADASSNAVAIMSPMVGTFYRAPAPDADPYVEVGDMVEAGQTVCIVEAMKLMNEIESEARGRIIQILVENAQPVEFGQKLFLIEPA